MVSQNVELRSSRKFEPQNDKETGVTASLPEFSLSSLSFIARGCHRYVVSCLTMVLPGESSIPHLFDNSPIHKLKHTTQILFPYFTLFHLKKACHPVLNCVTLCNKVSRALTLLHCAKAAALT